MQSEDAREAYQRGDWVEAERLCRAIVRDRPDDFVALNVWGIIAAQSQRPQEAVDLLSRAAAINPGNVRVHGNLGNVLHSLKRQEEALESCERALTLEPDDAFALNIRGSILRALNRPEEALDSMLRGLKVMPHNADALCMCSGLLGSLNRYEEALEFCNRALTIKTDYAEALNNKGNALGRLNQSLAALDCFAQALKIESDYAEAWSNQGAVLMDLQRYEEALGSYDRSLELKPDDANAHINLFVCLMQLGDFARGWDEYEWRWQFAKNRESRIETDIPAWNGQRLHGALLVWNEQGLGDEIFYASMLNELEQYATSITVCVDHRLVQLFARSFSNIHVISRQTLEPGAQFSAHVPMGSLGRYLRRSVNSFPQAARPYLLADFDHARGLRAQLAREKSLVCGVSWISKNPEFGVTKSLRLLDMEPVLTLPGVDFVDLQYGDTKQEQAVLYSAKGLRLKQVAEIDNFNDIDGLAALIQACDIVVTVSNTTAHLAAALGKPVLLMLPFSQGTFWYWYADRPSNPWYPVVRPFRQRVIGDWRDVICGVRDELARHHEVFLRVSSVDASRSSNTSATSQQSDDSHIGQSESGNHAMQRPLHAKRRWFCQWVIGIVFVLLIILLWRLGAA